MAVAVEVAEAEATAAAGPVAVMAGAVAVVDAAGAAAEAAILVRCLLEAGKRSLAAEWAHGVASAGVAATGTATIGVASVGVAAIGTIGTAMGIIIIIIMQSSSATSAFPCGGVGGIHITEMATATHTDMDTGTAMAIRMGGTTTAITAALTTAMATRLEGTRAAITAARATKMAIPPIQEWRSCNADLRGPGITLTQSMESWGLRRGEQLTLTSANMDLQANRGITACDAIDPPI